MIISRQMYTNILIHVSRFFYFITRKHDKDFFLTTKINVSNIACIPLIVITVVIILVLFPPYTPPKTFIFAANENSFFAQRLRRREGRLGRRSTAASFADARRSPRAGAASRLCSTSRPRARSSTG